MRQLAHVDVELVAALLSGRVCAAEIEPPEDAGLPVGRVAPDFSLPAQDGKQVSLALLFKKGPVAVGIRSIGGLVRRTASCRWCSQGGHLNEIEAAGGQVVAISYDPVEKLRNFAKRSKITFPLLSDADSKTIDAYDIRSPNAPKKFSGVSCHATFILDQSGVIRAKMFRLSYKERSAVDALINALKEARTFKRKARQQEKATHETTCPENNRSAGASHRRSSTSVGKSRSFPDSGCESGIRTSSNVTSPRSKQTSPSTDRRCMPLSIKTKWGPCRQPAPASRSW